MLRVCASRQNEAQKLYTCRPARISSPDGETFFSAGICAYCLDSCWRERSGGFENWPADVQRFSGTGKERRREKQWEFGARNFYFLKRFLVFIVLMFLFACKYTMKTQ